MGLKGGVTGTPFLVATVFLSEADSSIISENASSPPVGRLSPEAFYGLLSLFNPGFCTLAARPLSPAVIELTFYSTQGWPPRPTAEDLASYRRSSVALDLEREQRVEIVWQAASVFRTHKRLAVFDMDSTLIQQEVIDEIARTVGIKDEIAAITERAMNGELDFEASLRERCRLLKGVSGSVWEELKDVITLTPGVKETIAALRRLGYKTAVLSGGFMPLAQHIQGILKLDYAYANNLVVSDDGSHLTGELTGEIVHAERKRERVIKISAKEGILLEQVVCVGDGANDLPMMGVAGLGVAFNAKPRVQEAAPARLNRRSMQDLLYLLGLSKAEQEELTRDRAQVSHSETATDSMTGVESHAGQAVDPITNTPQTSFNISASGTPFG